MPHVGGLLHHRGEGRVQQDQSDAAFLTMKIKFKDMKRTNYRNANILL
jgi:hypothetical protein